MSSVFVASAPGPCAECGVKLKTGSRIGLLDRLARRLCIPCLRLELDDPSIW